MKRRMSFWMIVVVCLTSLAVSSLRYGVVEGKAKAAAWTLQEGFSYQPVPQEVKEVMTGCSYRKNPNVTYKDLRYVKVLHYNYRGEVAEGECVVNRSIAKDVVEIFHKLYQMEYPIQRMELVDEYGADDDRSMAANNTSAFNYRTMGGSSKLSLHAYGLAIDINPRVNPCVIGGRCYPENGKRYRQRNPKKCKGRYADNMVRRGDAVYRLFKRHGFAWGGDWPYTKDYQHFEYKR